jgi:two-component system sensor histidine kinase KdpD
MPEAAITDTRPSPEALLAAAQQEQRGKLKIFLGAAPGVGKTCEMLLSANRLLKQGKDVVVGIVETHGRRETQALLEGLPVLPRKVIAYRGKALEELDIDGVLARRPALVLVDELAHTNAEGSRHPKRWQDIEELLAAGIDVWTTLNIQHLESLNDVVARITQVIVRETVPDRVFDTADEVEIVDLTPNDLVQRLNEGKVYAEAQARAALGNYFKPGNLTALRELALRRTAERVDDQMRQYMRRHAIRGPWAASERLLVCVDESPASAELVRRAKRTADRLAAPWYALHFENARTQRLGAPAQERIVQTLRLAETMGAETLTLPGSRKIADELLAWAREHNITRIVIAKRRRPRWYAWLHGSIVGELVRSASGIELQIVADDSAAEPTADAKPEATSEAASAAEQRAITLAYLSTTGMVAVAVLLGRALVGVVDMPNVSIVFLAAVLWSATRYGRWPSIYASVLGTLAYDFFFIPPVYTFTITDPGELLALIFFCAAAVLVSTLAAREQAQGAAARTQARTTAELLAFSRRLAGIRRLDTLMAATAAQLSNLLRAEALLLLPAPDGALKLTAGAPEVNPLEAAELAAATWCWQHGQPTGRGTDTLPGARHLFLPLATGQGRLGVIGIRRDTALTPAERRLLDALADLAAIATERVRLAKDVDQARMATEAEKLRASLLTSISHDLRTPLASIIGSISALRSYGAMYDDATRGEMLATAQDEAERLNRHIANLLDMTRLEAGALKARREPCDLQDLAASAVARMAPQMPEHRVRVAVPENLPLLLLDAGLMEQVFANLLDNAAKYTPAGSLIEILAARHRFSIVITVRDDGPGIPAEQIGRVFEKFYRGRESNDRSRAGTGLGLAICRGFVEAMGGRISVRNRSEGPGAEFVIEFGSDVIADTPGKPEAA